MVTQAPEATPFIPQATLPPEAMISPRLEAVATSLGGTIGWPNRQADILLVLRLLCPFGDSTGLALSAPEQPAPLVCTLAAHFARQANRLDEVPFLDTLGLRLQNDVARQAFPELFQRPGPNANVLWGTHAQLASTPTYRLLAIDLQGGLIAALARTGWMWTAAAAKSMDAMITSALRIIPRLSAEVLAQALASHDPFACGKVIREAACDLTYLRHPDRLLPRATQLGYMRDCCRLLNHPEWVSTEMGDAPLGEGNDTVRSHRGWGWQFDDDDPPETEAAPDRFRERHLEKLEREVRRQVSPGAALDEVDTDLGISGLLIYGEELAVLREYPHPLAWHAAHPNDIAALVGMIFRDTAPSGSFAITRLSTEKLLLRTALLTLCLTGRTLDWLLQVRVGDWPDPAACLPSMPPCYVPAYDAIVYWPEAIPELPTQPEQTADLFEPVSPVWVLPLPDPLLHWWRELAHRCAKGERALTLTADQVEDALKSATSVLREKTPNMPALTQGRLRAAHTALMERDGQLDPLLAACISGQWRTSLRVPLFYTTLSLPLLADRYRAAARRVWTVLRQTRSVPQLPDAFGGTPTALPELRVGSPYYPRLAVVRQAVQILRDAVAQAISNEDRHNAKTLLALYGLSLLMGLRISEAASLQTVDFDLRATWQREALPWVVLPETKGNRWTSAARIVPLPDCLLPLLRELLPDDLQAPALSFRTQGRLVAADKGEIRRRLAEVSVPFPRWHAGRHLLRTFLLEQGLPFDATNAILGHQSAGRELFNPYLPGDPGKAWRPFRLLSDRLAHELGWPVECECK
ncbi:MAG: hypothetical protein ACRDH2_00170 [Anaerolineales bacterium]